MPRNRYIIKLLLVTVLVFSGQMLFADAMSRGDYGISSSNNGIGSFGNAPKESPILNVPLPSANSSYYANPESINYNIHAPIKTVNKIVAFVNRGVITSNEVNVQVNQSLQTFKMKGLPPPNPADIRSRVIEQLIMQRIQLDLAARGGIKTTDLEVADAINNIAKQNNMTLDQFKDMVVKQGTTFDEFRKQIRDQITIDKLKQREVDGRVSVNDDEVNLVLNSEAYKNRIDYNLSDIIVGVPEQATPDVVMAKQNSAIAAYNELKAGHPFYQVAAKYSNAPNALSGGELGWKANATLPGEILKNLEGLPIGSFTSIIHLPVGFFIFKVNDIKKHGAPQIIKQYHVRHILIKVNEITGDEEAHQKIMGIRNTIIQDAADPAKESADFIRLAKQYSEDTSSINGGDIGWVSKGDTVPAFEQAMINTPVGVVSEPIHSPFGWHILQVIGTRESNLSNDREKAEIRQEIHENKANTLYNQWLRDIRDSAYVKMNDN